MPIKIESSVCFRSAIQLKPFLLACVQIWVCKLTKSVVDFVQQGTDYAQERAIFERVVHNRHALDEFVNVMQRGTPAAKVITQRSW